MPVFYKNYSSAVFQFILKEVRHHGSQPLGLPNKLIFMNNSRNYTYKLNWKLHPEQLYYRHGNFMLP